MNRQRLKSRLNRRGDSRIDRNKTPPNVIEFSTFHGGTKAPPYDISYSSHRRMQSEIQYFCGTPRTSSPTIIITISHITTPNVIKNSTFFGRSKPLPYGNSIFITSPNIEFKLNVTARIFISVGVGSTAVRSHSGSDITP